VSGSGERASQVVLGVGMVAWKLRAGQMKYGFHLRRGRAATEQFFGDPQVGDAPIGVRKALRNVQAVQPSLLDDGGLVSREGRGDVVRGWHRVTALRIRRWKPRGDRSGARHAVGCSRHQGSAVRRQAHGGMPALHPRRGSIGRAPLGFLMGESGQPSQMAPVGAGRVALVPAGQLSSDCGCQLRWQRLRTHPNPNLQVAGTGLDHGARCMAVGAHDIQDGGRGAVQIHQNVAGVVAQRIRPEIDVKSLAVAGAQESYGGLHQDLRSGPKAFAWIRFSGVVVNQADQITPAGHSRELTADSPQRQRESATQHAGGTPSVYGLGCGVGAEVSKAPHTGKLSQRPEGQPGF
jgi:hypothetical protein